MQLPTNPTNTATVNTAQADDTVKMSFSRQHLSLLKLFLERSEIKGYEVSRFLEIARIIAESERSASAETAVKQPKP